MSATGAAKKRCPCSGSQMSFWPQHVCDVAGNISNFVLQATVSDLRYFCVIQQSLHSAMGVDATMIWFRATCHSVQAMTAATLLRNECGRNYD